MGTYLQTGFINEFSFGAPTGKLKGISSSEFANNVDGLAIELLIHSEIVKPTLGVGFVLFFAGRTGVVHLLFRIPTTHIPTL
jgi:hypothetical protein